jgi:cupin fold WbuC family metalloprotein
MTKIFTADRLKKLADEAAETDRLRTHLNVHERLDANVQRLFIATEPATYMRPHRHPEPHKWEFFVVLEGAIDLLIFDHDGSLLQRIEMAPDKARAVEVPPNVWHAYVCQKSGTVALEIKEGTYIPTPEEDFAPWSPAENTAEAAALREWMRDARPGSKPMT